MAAMNPLRIEYGEKRYIKRSASEIEKDMVKAMKSGMIDVIGHPTGNIEPEKVRKISWERIFDVARHQGVLIEVNLNEDIPEWWLSELAGSGNMISFGSDWHGMYQFRKFRPKEGVGPSESDLISRVNEGGRNSYDSLSSDEKESFDRIYTSSELDEDFFDWVGLEIRKVMNAGIAEGRIFNSRGSQFLDAFVKKPKNERRKYIANL